MEKEILNKLRYLINKKKCTEDILLTLDISIDELYDCIDNLGKEGHSFKVEGSKIVPLDKFISEPYVLPFNKDTLKIVAYADSHLSSINDRQDFLEQTFEFASKKDVDVMINGGDLFEGMIPSDIKKNYLKFETFESQLEYVERILPIINIPHLIVGGNHDALWSKYDGRDILSAFASDRKDVTYLGPKKRDVYVGGLKIHINHGDEINSRDPLKGTEEYVDLLDKDDLPFLLLKAHLHKAWYYDYNNVHIFQIPALISDLPYSRCEFNGHYEGFWYIEVYFEKNKPIDFTAKLKKTL